MTEHTIVPAEQVGNGERVLTEINGREIGIFNNEGEYFAFLNWCPHQGGPLCEGTQTGRQCAEYDSESRKVEFEWIDDGEIIACPWHNWEFDLKTGKNIPKQSIEIPNYPVKVEDGMIVVTVE